MTNATYAGYLDKEQAQRNRKTGQKGGLFLIYTSVAYGAMFLRMRKENHPFFSGQ
jgi:hypothetical protein